jgi:glycosyltransferase involved in cell wall biosynthesis
MLKNNSNFKISICMASYNGEDYICEQIFSILSQLKEFDELIIVDDCSSDSTVNLIRSIPDKRIKLHINNINVDHVKTFERAIKIAKGDYIFLSDQDDIWVEGRVDKMIECMVLNNYDVLFSNFSNIDTKGDEIDDYSLRLYEADSSKNIRNILRIFWGSGHYWGCSMCFNRCFTNVALPIPSSVLSHDIWFALVGLIKGKLGHLEEKTLKHRLHSKNKSPVKRRNIWLVLLSRVHYIFYLMRILGRVMMKN